MVELKVIIQLEDVHLAQAINYLEAYTFFNMDDRTTEILKRFSNSWTDTKNFYDNLIDNYLGFERLRPVRKFIDTLKQMARISFFDLEPRFIF